jgi:periplasmic divalent cation tolerance protein
MTMARFAMLYVTARDEEEGTKIAQGLIEKRLVACANMFPVKSLYRWKGEVVEEAEVALIMKTRAELIPRAIDEVRLNHSYEVPCVVSYPMGEALPAYTQWIEAETR